MPNALFESEYIFGIHDPGGEEHMLEAEKPGWILFNEVIGHDPDDHRGKDFARYAEQNLGILCQLNNGRYPAGTIPHNNAYANFARRCANFVAASQGCHIWIIGNEMNYAVERPGSSVAGAPTEDAQDPEAADPTLRGLRNRFNILQPGNEEGDEGDESGEIITPERYTRCYRLCRNAIHQVAGHENDQVLIGAIAPWNTQTSYPGNLRGDWVKYFQDILVVLGPSNCDGITLHTYSHGTDPNLIGDDSRLEAFSQYHTQFRAYQDFMHAIPANMRHLPAYITSTNQEVPWENRNNGWIQEAYREIDRWNRQSGHQPIRALILYRWAQIDKWYIAGKAGVVADFQQALRSDYRWNRAVRPQPVAAQEEIPTEDEGNHRPAGPPAYRAQWIKGRLPKPLPAGAVVTFPITVRNIGNMTWTRGGDHPVRLGYRFFQNREEVTLRSDQQIRTSLPKDVVPGQTITFEAQIALPDTAGNYTLQIDLVHEGVTWFGDENSDLLTRWLTVSPPEDEVAPPIEGQEEGRAERPAQPDSAPAFQTVAHPWRVAPSVDSDAGTLAPETLTVGVPVATGAGAPAITDVSRELPRGENEYAQRPLSQIRYLVINHTGAPPVVDLATIARAHVDQGYPGIAYDYFITQDGRILQVSPLEAVVDSGEAWSSAGINICLEGDFSEKAPPPIQIDAAADLCAWLIERFDLTIQDIVGLRELIPTLSPGDTFLEGPAWKRSLQNHIAQQLEVEQPPSEEETETGQETRAAVEAPRVEEEEPPAAVERLEAPPEEEPDEEKVVRPPIQDIITRLPRDPNGFYSRRPEDIQYVVINHTAMPASVPIEAIAEAFREKLPGILYQYYIAEDGTIYQTQPLLQTVSDSQPYIANAINIGFAGDFTEDVPTPAQIVAGGQLIAWLMDEYPQLEADDIQGLREFIPHKSPGDQWLSGRRWKDMLLNAVIEARRPEGSADTEWAAELQRQLQTLRSRNQTLQQETQKMQRQNARLRQVVEDLQADPERRAHIAKPAIHDIVDQLPHHPTLHYERRPLSDITHIAVHHTAAPPYIGPERVAELHINADPSRGKKAWPGIGYHFFIHADGTIDQTNELETISYHVYRNNEYTVGVAFAGSFMNGNVPTTTQRQSGARLIAWLMQELAIPLEHVWGHKEFPQNSTVCPGNEWQQDRQWRDDLYQRIVNLQSSSRQKPIYHYMLFWQRPHPGGIAQDDLHNAMAYIERFRPTIGFSVDDAMLAEYVTIVGGDAGVSGEAEARIRESGSKVERLAGRDEEETAEMLQELVEQRRRFRKLDAG